MKQEPTAGGLANPICVLDDLSVKPDADKDGLWDEEEIAAALGGTGTNPLLADSDGDGLPDGWEIAEGLDPKPGSGNSGQEGRDAEPDHDGFSNWEEYCGDTAATG